MHTLGSSCSQTKSPTLWNLLYTLTNSLINHCPKPLKRQYAPGGTVLHDKQVGIQVFSCKASNGSYIKQAQDSCSIVRF